MPESRVTQVSAEMLIQPTVTARVSKVSAEMLIQPTITARVSQISLEVLTVPAPSNPQYLTLMGCGTR